MRGFTLPELMLVLAVAAILLALAAPDLRDLVRRQQLKAAAADLFTAVDLARTQALARGTRVVLAPRKATGDAAGADWRTGWIVYVDVDEDGRRGPADLLIAEHGPLAPGMAVATAFTGRAPPEYIAYNGAGRGCGLANSAAARWGTVSLFHGGGIRRITINMLGRARLCDPARDAACAGPARPP
jgi:type IV fimbrial biogenesis protein FimT